LLKNYFMNYYSIIGDKFLEKNKSGYNWSTLKKPMLRFIYHWEK
jgi:hypothetical protein